MVKKLIFIFIVFFLSLEIVFALGVIPGRTTVNFEPGLNKKINFSVFNSDNENISLSFKVRGDLSKYIDFQAKEFSIGRNKKIFEYTLNLPDDFRKIGAPGEHKTEILILEKPEEGMNKEKKEIEISGTLGVTHELIVYIPYPEKYVLSDIEIISNPSDILFAVPVNNRGKLNISEARVVLDIYDYKREKIKSFETDSKFVGSLKRKDFLIKVNTSEFIPGNYFANASIFYDENSHKLSREFQIGEKFLSILEIGVKNFRIGEVVVVETLIKNNWGGEVKNISLNILIYDEGEIIANINSFEYAVSPLEEKILVSYWNTSGIEEGYYSGKIILNYEDEKEEKEVNLRISEKGLEIFGITGRVIQDRQEELNRELFWFMIIFLFVIASIILFFRIRFLIKKIFFI